MTLEASFELSGDELLVGELAAEFPSVSIEIERVVPAGEQVMPYIWVSGEETLAFGECARQTPDVESVVLLDEFADRALYRIQWSKDTEQFVSGILETGGTVIEASGRSEWTFRIRFESRGDLAAFRTHCRGHGIDCRLQQVQVTRTAVAPDQEFGLTDAQREALAAAVAQGYFEVPRAATFEDISADLDISQQALSERVRRGVNKIVTTAID